MEEHLKQGATSFQCPNCGVVSQQTWFGLDTVSRTVLGLVEHLYFDSRKKMSDYQQESIIMFLEILKDRIPRVLPHSIPASFSIATCQACRQISLWIDGELVHPKLFTIESPNKDLNQDIQDLYNEAATISALSPKGAAALLRLALQKLMLQLGKKGKKINDDIKELVNEGLSPKIQQSLDLLRVVGNNAVHPGEISFDDDSEVAQKMFRVLNIVAEELITQPREIDRLYNEVIPAETRDYIQTRDGK